MKIDSNIPIPKRSCGTGAKSRYPWKDMVPGDSFFLEGDPMGNRKRVEASFYIWRSRFSSRKDYKIEIRSVDEGIRVWRTA